MSRPGVAPAQASSSLRPAPTQQSSTPRPSPYSPSPAELHGGPKNRLFLSLRSGIPSEIDWALPRLVVASFEQPDKFRLETWVDSVGILQQWPEKWITELEKRSRPETASLTSQWILDPLLEKRATESLLILRNAALATGTNNPVLISRQSFLALLERFFALPHDFLVETTLKHPEAVSHLLSILNSILGLLKPYPEILPIFSTVLPKLFLSTRDSAMITLLLPIFITTVSIPNLPLLPTDFIPHLFQLIALKPPSPMLDLLLDLLVSLSQNPIYAKQILQDNHFQPYLKSLVPMLEHASKPFPARWDSAPSNAGKVLRNPASHAYKADEASLKRAKEREECQRIMESGGTVDVPVGDAPPILPQSIKSKLYAMQEPKRSIQWMHETFVYSSRSQLLQVTFWHAYRDFFTHTSTVEQLLSASDVIKNVTIAFPGASAKVWTDATGQQKFVIAGMGFRRSVEEDTSFGCRWSQCPYDFTGRSPADLFNHVMSQHIRFVVPPSNCAWATCRMPLESMSIDSHIATHMPSTSPLPVPESIIVHPSIPDNLAFSPRPTLHPPAPLPRSVKLAFTAQYTPSDSRRQPTGPPFLAALVLRNLARALRNEIALATPPITEGEGTEAAQTGAQKKKQLLEERYGLPIPDSVLREEEEEERNLEKDDEDGMKEEQREKAVLAFQMVEEKVLGVMENNMAGLAAYLGTAVGW